MQKSIYTADYDRFRQVLRGARKDRGVTQAELADRLGWTQTKVSKCERGERRLDIVETRRWCMALGLTLNDFVSEMEPCLSKRRRKR